MSQTVVSQTVVSQTVEAKTKLGQAKTSPSKPSQFADINLLVVALIWGINIAFMKLAISQFDLFVFNSIRLSLSAVVLGICVWFENKHRPQPNTLENPPSALKKWSMIALFALFSGAVYQIIFVIGMNWTTAGNTALIMSSMPMWTAILAFLLFSEKIGNAWIGLTITFLGTLVVTLENGGFSLESANLTGNLMILVAAIAWALGAVFSRPMLTYVSPIRLAFYATTGTLPVHFSMMWIFPSETGFSGPFPPMVIACILYSGIFSTGIAYAMWNYGVQKLGPSYAAVYQNLVPLVALIAAWFFLGEVISVLQIIGGFLIIFGLFVTRRIRAKLTPAEKVA